MKSMKLLKPLIFSLICLVGLQAPVDSYGAESRQKQSSGRTTKAKAKANKAVKASKAKPVKARRVKAVKPLRQRKMAQAVAASQAPNAAHLAALRSSAVVIIDPKTQDVLYQKNQNTVMPIASLTKLMTALVVLDANQSMSQQLTVTSADVDRLKYSSSRLQVGTTLSRTSMLHLALMSSENRAASALGRNYPGGTRAFVAAMNRKARALGMRNTRYVEPTGLSSKNQSSARDLAILVGAAHADPMLRELTTSPGYQVEVGRRTLQYNNTNRLVKNPAWDIGLQKTGYISEAGQCLVMQAKVAGRKLIMVFLDSAGKLSRIGDAERVRRWVESNHPVMTAHSNG